MNGCDGQGYGMIVGKNGCEILICGEHVLDIDAYTYFWDKERVDVPREEFKTTYGSNSPIVETYGDKSPVTTGDDSPIIQDEENILIQLFWSKRNYRWSDYWFLTKNFIRYLEKKICKEKIIF